MKSFVGQIKRVSDFLCTGPYHKIKKTKSQCFLIYDAVKKEQESKTGKCLKMVWKNTNFSGNFQAVFPSKKEDGFKESIQNLLTFLLNNNETIKELHFWCHGGFKQRIYSGSSVLDIDDLKVLKPYIQEKSAIWFRSCNFLADSSDKKVSQMASVWAEKIQKESGFKHIGGHTVVIGLTHPECYVYTGNNQWLGPKQSYGNQTERLLKFFKL